MPSVLQELEGENILLDHAHVHERAEDWKRRISNLYGQILSWLPELESDREDSVELNEEMMRAYGVSSSHVPVLRLLDHQRQVAKFVPRGLWVIGSNGRIDLFSDKGLFLIVDRSEYFRAPRWEIAPSLQRLDAKPFTRDALLQAIQ